MEEKAFYTGNGTLERREYYQYDDEWGDLKSVITYDGSGNIDRRESFHYDEVTGRMVAKISPEGTLWYSYNERGRLSEIKSSTGLRTVYAYDEYGRVKSVTDPGMSLDGSEDKSVTYSYDALGRKDVVTYPNGATVDYDYEDTRGGWVQKITHKDGSNALILSLTYDRDAAGTILEILEDRNETDPDVKTYKWAYEYDGLKRLKKATLTPRIDGVDDLVSQTTYEYTYDRRGNRLSKTVDNGDPRNFVYNDLDQLVEENQTGEPTLSYTWDKFGRLESETGGAKTKNYEWSVDDQLVRVTFDQGIPATEQTIEYGYNHQGDRTRREVTGNGAAPEDLDKLYLTDRKNLTGYCQALAEVDGTSGDTLRNYVYGPDYAPLAQSTAAGAPDFFHADHLGTTRALTTSTGSASLVQQYEPYGTPSNGALSSLTSKYFTAQDRDVYTNLQYHRARWLDTDQGRWYSQDPVFDFPGNFGNGYGYVGESQLNCLDVNGMFTLNEMLGAAAILSVVLIGLIFNCFWFSQHHPQEVQRENGVVLPYKHLDREVGSPSGKRIYFNFDPAHRSRNPEHAFEKDKIAPSYSSDYHEPQSWEELDTILKSKVGELKKGDVIEVHFHGGSGVIFTPSGSFNYQNLSDYIPKIPKNTNKKRSYEPLELENGVIVHLIGCSYAGDPDQRVYENSENYERATWERHVGPATSKYFGGNKVIAYDHNTYTNDKDWYWIDFVSYWYIGNQKECIYDPSVHTFGL